MKKNIRDIESIADTVGIELDLHLNFGIVNPTSSSLTPVVTAQSSPTDILDNIEKRA